MAPDLQPGDLVAVAEPIVRRRGRRARLSEQDVEDLLQDVLVKYMQAWRGGGAPENVAAWFERATANAVADRMRAAARRPADPYAEGGDDPLALAMAAIRGPQVSSQPVVAAALLEEVFALLAPADADLIRLRYLQGCSAAELAAVFGITVANLDQRTTRAKRRLREALQARPDLVDELRQRHPRLY